MAKVLLTLELDPRKATVAHVRKTFGLSASEIDTEYGIVSIAPDEHLYVALVDEAAATRITGVRGVRGTHSNPRIEPFGPPGS